MDKPLPTPVQAYRGLIAGYTEAIRSSDFKANIAFLFVAFMMGSVLWNYTSFPSYLPIQLVLLPFLIVYFFLFMVLIPRYPKRGAKTFLVARNLTPADFEFVARTVRRCRTIEADLRGAIRHSLVEDAVYSRRLSRGDRLRRPDHGSASLRLARLMPGRARRVSRSL